MDIHPLQGDHKANKGQYQLEEKYIKIIINYCMYEFHVIQTWGSCMYVWMDAMGFDFDPG
jgi:hypothetical protein